MTEHGLHVYHGGNGLPRCPWCKGDALYERYHDEEWGTPVHDDRLHFEFLVLESFQAGLSWLTVLRKRARFRERFTGFDPEAVAAFSDETLDDIRGDAGVIRNRAKIAAARTNARAFLTVAEEFGSFDRYIWGFVAGTPLVNRPRSLDEVPARTELSDTVSGDLRSRGFTFVGSTMVYAHLQATGIVDDHLAGCFRAE